MQQQGSWDINDISAGVQTNDVKVTLDSEAVAITGTVTVDLGANNDVTIDNSSIVLAEDAVHGTGDAGIMPLAVRNDILAALAGTDGDYAPLQVDASGALYIQEGSALDVSAAVVSVDDNAGSLTVDASELTTLAGAVSGTEMQVDVVASLPAGTNAIGKLAANSGVDIGDVDVLSIAAGSNLIGDVGLAPRTSGGLTIFRSLDIDESEEQIKGSAGQVYHIAAFNTTAAPLYLKFYNLTAANTTVGTSTPVLTYLVPGNADSDGAGFVMDVPQGIAFGTAITVACTTGVADNDTGAPGANACVIDILYA